MKILAIGCFVFAALSLVVESQGIIKGELQVRNLLIPVIWAAGGLFQWIIAVRRERQEAKRSADDSIQSRSQ